MPKSTPVILSSSDVVRIARITDVLTWAQKNDKCVTVHAHTLAGDARVYVGEVVDVSDSVGGGHVTVLTDEGYKRATLPNVDSVSMR